MNLTAHSEIKERGFSASGLKWFTCAVRFGRDVSEGGFGFLFEYLITKDKI